MHGEMPTRGVYGLRLNGIDGGESLVSAPEDWPTLTIERCVDPRTLDSDTVEEDWAEYRTLDNTLTVRLERDPLVVRYRSAREMISDDAVLHPGLAMVASIVARWSGRDAFHAGGFVTESGAWAVLGHTEAGKSSMLGRLSMSGTPILTDDVLVVQDGWVMAGPRFVDLREGAAQQFGVGLDVGVIGTRRRWRVSTGDAPATVPLSGWIVPQWGDSIRIRTVPPGLRMPLLHANLALRRVPVSPARMLGLAALPCLAFHRPKNWDDLDRGLRILLDHLDG